MRKKSGSGVHLSSKDKYRFSKKEGTPARIKAKPITEFILRLHVFTLFPEKYTKSITKEVRDDIKNLLFTDKNRRDPKKKSSIIKNHDIIENIVEGKYRVDIFSDPAFSLLSKKEWQKLLIYSIQYELENWIKTKRKKTFKNAKQIVSGRIGVKAIWWKAKRQISPYDEYLKEVDYALKFLSELSEEDYNRRIKKNYRLFD